MPNAGPIKSQTIGIENRPLQRKLTMSDEYFHQGQAGFASELGCWNECVTEVGEIDLRFMVSQWLGFKQKKGIASVSIECLH